MYLLKKNSIQSYILTLFTNCNVVPLMVPVMAKLNIILRLECVITCEFSALTGKRIIKVMMIPPLNNIFYSAITDLILNIS